MKKLYILMSIILLFLSSCANQKDNTGDSANEDQVTPYPTEIENDDGNVNTANKENILHLDIQDEMLHISLENGRYNLSAMIDKIVAEFQAEIIEQDEEYTIIHLKTEYADQKFRISGSHDISLQVVKTRCLQFDPPNLYRLYITLGVQTENGIYEIGDILMDMNDYEGRLSSSYILFVSNIAYQVIDYIPYEKTTQNLNYSSGEYNPYVFILYYTGIPREYYAVRYEEKFSEDVAYGYQPVDEGKVYTLGDECEIFLEIADFEKEAFPESTYPYKYYGISEVQLRTEAVLSGLFYCYVIDDEIIHIDHVVSP